DSTECGPLAPTCTNGRCAACAAFSMDCDRFAATPVCGPAGACVECTSAGECAAQHKTCDTTHNACIACAHHSECATGACKAGGSCADALEVAYVDNHAETVADCKL